MFTLILIVIGLFILASLMDDTSGTSKGESEKIQKIHSDLKKELQKIVDSKTQTKREISNTDNKKILDYIEEKRLKNLKKDVQKTDIESIHARLSSLRHASQKQPPIKIIERAGWWNEIETRGIEELVHFTKLSNLASILMSGIRTRENMDRSYIDYYFNDAQRFDRNLNATSLSITFPNYKMFYSLRCKNPQDIWCIFLLEPTILINKDCAFYYTNAASAKFRGVSLTTLKSIESFRKMFYSDHYKGVPINYTRDPQAEVMVFDTIEPSYIKGIVVDENDYQIVVSYLKRHNLERFIHKIKIDQDYYFAPRSDWKEW